MESLLPFLLFSFVASITPGPTNILVLSHSSRRGLSATLPIIFGACGAAALIVLAVGLGVGETLLRFPLVQHTMTWGGVLWLSWLAWQISQSAPPSLDFAAPREEGLSVFGAATLQLVNPKVWMMAAAVVSVFAEGSDKTQRLLVLSLAFLLVSLPCMTLWALLGVGSARVFGAQRGFKRMNHVLALLLLVSAWLSVLV
ncbi:LysE family translocator [Pseudomonas cannabina]|uniref:Lysine exporter protein LysE/YggA n=3 Tax=Pseudomonas syringae group TaxID=136849 RepID=A0A3M3R4I2_PSECA|nr:MULTISPECIES: LysE family translocator [Pseudomonas syringae group]KPB74160.1 Lysine exporter protein LysE/YggA [Pseudomonas syringae pv. maculicola]KPW24329.1 Lysine exporter protein LysE/YggA [Pseudomonas cannabina pv. alisalensis]MBM0137923.1 LysE family translocator [Pseudomonas cannabina pv. alisalensis]QHE95538.1 LysE family transporter [Pseudomonas syringae pv. maculicola str. ES4326]QQN22499.1 LysE family translocator [Pseudomonas cannabina pv. alisalensis]